MDRFVTRHIRSRETFTRAREPRERDRDVFALRLVVSPSVETRAETGKTGEMGTGTLRFSPAVTARMNRARAPRWTTRPLARGGAREKGLTLRRAVGDASANGGPRREGEEEDDASPRVDEGGERERERATDAVRSEEDASDVGDASDVATRDGDVETAGVGEAREVRDASALAPDASAATRTTATRTTTASGKTRSTSTKKKKKKKKAVQGQRTGGTPAMGVDPVVIGAGAAALGAVGYFAWTKLRGGAGGGGAASVDGGRGDDGNVGGDAGSADVAVEGMTLSAMGLSSGGDVPVTSDEGMDGPVSAAPVEKEKQKKIITREAKRRLRDVMDELRRVQTVDVSGKNLGDEGACFIAEAFAYNNVASCVDLSANGIGTEGITALCEALKCNDTLTMLSLASNSLGDDGATVLAEYLKTDQKITTLNLNACSIGDEGAKALAEALKTNTTITSLEMNNNVVDYEGSGALAQAFAQNSTVELLALSGNYVGALGASALGAAFKENTGLRSLQLNGNDIGNEGCIKLCEGLAARSKKISNLDLGNNSIGPDAGPALRDYLKDDDSLTHLNLYMNELANDGCAAIAEALKDNKKIESLDIGGNNIGAFGAEKLAEALRDNGALETLELGYNPIGVPGGKALAETVKFHGKLNTMRMGWCKIGKEGGYAFADAIKYSSSLAVLDLRGNDLGDDGVASLAQSLGVVNEVLTNLDLGYNEIKDKGAFALAQAIKNNAEGSLQTLSVNNNYLTKFGEVALTEAVELVEEMNADRDLYIQF